mmetsp:Transcript_109617/g.353740  ORF Transcript_109617/g.353740 Transcript_109617/m.353740 type:complete len:87 (+) Transcript_109617:591-851(+)
MFNCPLMAALSSAAIRSSAELLPQNLSNTAWAFATCRVVDEPLMDAISAASSSTISQFDIQGLANTLWSFASLLLPHFPILPPLRR